MPKLKCLYAPWIVPVEPRDVVLRDHCLVIEGEQIVDLLPGEEAGVRYRDAEQEHFPGQVLLPGLVNAHTHAAMVLMRGLADDLPLKTWLEEHIWPAEAANLSPGFVRDGTRLAVAEMLRGGTTCFADKYFFPEAALEVAIEAGMRTVTGLVVIDFPTPWAADPDEALEKGLALHERWHNHPRAHFALAPHAPYSVSDVPLERIRVLSDQLDIPVHMHVHETAGEIDDSLAATGERPLGRLARLGLVNERLVAVHMTQLIDEEIMQLAEAGSSVIHCPESNLKLASGFCPVQRLLDAGITVGLGTDGAASNNDLDMFGEMRTAALIAKPVAGSAAALNGHETLRMATLGGAKAFGIDHLCGSLTVGKQADVIAVDLSTLESRPVFDPISHLVYATARHQVSNVWVAGRRLLRERELTTLDPVEIHRDTDRWQAVLEKNA
ncbi:MAG: TRZ/ATZ family hydrolase [Halothiobacillaceae bacterium]